MDRAELLAFLRRHRLCIQASVSEQQSPQAAVVGFAISDQFELVFDTLRSSRKAQNLRRNPSVALVIGWDDERTVQLEGLADEPRAGELERIKKVYFGVYPDGIERQHWPGITYFRVRTRWARYSDFGAGGSVREFSMADLGVAFEP
jgi:nitroimidazol reductase NimA-like FMN-containing flavoprotein (pyridoxamine 5'-phosphate oxidase superfamily)